MMAYHMQCQSLQQITLEEFLKGAEVIGGDSVEKWQQAVPVIRKQLADNSQFKKMYLYVFNAAQETKMSLKNVAVDDACAYWQLLLGSKCNYLPKWSAFLQAKKTAKQLNVVTKDTWDMFYELLESNKGDLSKSEDDGTWPTLIDDFCRQEKVFQ